MSESIRERHEEELRLHTLLNVLNVCKIVSFVNLKYLSKILRSLTPLLNVSWPWDVTVIFWEQSNAQVQFPTCQCTWIESYLCSVHIFSHYINIYAMNRWANLHQKHVLNVLPFSKVKRMVSHLAIFSILVCVASNPGSCLVLNFSYKLSLLVSLCVLANFQESIDFFSPKSGILLIW